MLNSKVLRVGFIGGSAFVVGMLLLLVVNGLLDNSYAAPSEEELTRLDSFAERYNVPKRLKQIEKIPYDADKGFTFVAWGDVRSNPKVFTTLWDSINTEPALFSICTGDLVQRGSTQEWLDDFFPIVDRHDKVIFLPVLGNHDVGDNRTEYQRIFGVRDYYFDYGNARFIIVDNSGAGFSDQQMQWMEDLLKSAEGKFTYVFAHKPPKTIEKWAYHSFDQNADEFCALMTRYKVSHVFLGHIHAYSTATHDGVDYTITGGGGAGLHSRYGELGNIHHYLVVHQSPSGMKQEVVRLLDGKLVRGEPGNEFYQAPVDLLTPKALAAVQAMAPKGDIEDVGLSKENGQSWFEVEVRIREAGKPTRDVEVVVSEDGTIAGSEWELFEDELPERVRFHIQRQYAGHSFVEATKIKEGEHEQMEVRLRSGDRSIKDLLFTEEGEPVLKNN